MTAIVRTVKDSGKYLADRYRISQVQVDSLNFEESGQNFDSMSKFWEEIEKKKQNWRINSQLFRLQLILENRSKTCLNLFGVEDRMS